MSELQERIIKETKDLISPFSIANIIINAFFSGAVVLLVVWILQFEVNAINISIIFVVAILWTTLRDLFRSRKVKTKIEKDLAYVNEKKPYATLYVPIFGRVGARQVLKNAALFFIEEKLYMEAFKLSDTNRGAIESVTVKQGKDFLIEQYKPDEKRSFITYEAKLMDTEYSFSIPNIPELIEMIENSKGEKN